QNGVCAICLEAPAAHVDHDHETGRVRGLLCFNCNGALGQFRDRPDLMSRAAIYLTAGSKAVAELAPFQLAMATGSGRPDGEDNAYLFEFLDELEAV
ncbi:endonuclease VII domain-containing protein, partial [Jatrophihabitans endophyticus]|uniref:endonuclease VII domain-containing protein n=1 Tax=Jatrophihabitans endophyticus TaxID=1206085 RepID=UPI0019D8EA72